MLVKSIVGLDVSRVLARGSRVLARGSQWFDYLSTRLLQHPTVVDQETPRAPEQYPPEVTNQHPAEVVDQLAPEVADRHAPDVADQHAPEVAGQHAAKAPDEYPTKINVGCGKAKLEGYLNVDIDPDCAPDLLIVDGDDSAIPRRYFSEVLACDVLEHFPRAQTQTALLDFADYLVDGGKLVLKTTSILHIAAKLNLTVSYADHHSWTICLFGNQEHPGDFHYSGFTEVTLRTHLVAAGFSIKKLEVQEDWMFEVEAVKIADWASLLDSTHHLDDRDFVHRAYQAAFDRNAEWVGLTHYSTQLGLGVSRKEVLKKIFSAPERLFKIADRNPLDVGYTSTGTVALLPSRYAGDYFGGWEVGDIELFKRYAQPSAPAVGKVTNFLGIKTATEFVPWAIALDGKVIQDAPIPDDGIGAEAIEYFALLDSIEMAPKTSFTVVEVGASYGPWICASAVLAMRTRRSTITLVAVEASSYMFGLIEHHLTENGITSELANVTLIHGIISPHRGSAYFPKATSARENGFQAVPTPAEIEYAGRRLEYETVEAYTITDVLPDGMVDFLHVDIQGLEALALAASMARVNETVRGMFVASHSRKIEGELIELLHSNGWILVRERPTRFSYDKGASNAAQWTTIDGGQYWRNLRQIA